MEEEERENRDELRVHSPADRLELKQIEGDSKKQRAVEDERQETP